MNLPSRRIIRHALAFLGIFTGKRFKVAFVPDAINKTQLAEFLPGPHHIGFICAVFCLYVDDLPVIA
jgi:hypothetical protein